MADEGRSHRVPEDDRPSLILASSSPSRASLLRAAGIEPIIVPSLVDEPALIRAAAAAVSGDAYALTQLLADAKAAEVLGRLASESHAGPGRPSDASLAGATRAQVVLGADSMLSFRGQVLGKARDADEVRSRWAAMSGGTGVLVTGHALVDRATGRWARATVGTTIHFGRPDPDELEAYIDSGEPLAVAGSCTIDGIGGAFIDGIEGDHTNVIGLSLPTVRRLLGGLGVRWTDLWPRSPGQGPHGRGPNR